MISKLFNGADEGDIVANFAMLFLVILVSTVIATLFGGLMATEDITTGIITGITLFIIFITGGTLVFSSERDFNLKIYLSLLGIIVLIIPSIIFFFVHLTSLIPNWGVALAVLGLFILITEILFWLDKSKPKRKKDVMFFTFKRKAEAGTESGFIIVLAGTVAYVLKEYNLFEKIKQFFIAIWEWLKLVVPALLKFLGVALLIFGAIVLVIFLVYLYIRLNSMKYKNSFKTKSYKKVKK